MQYYVYVSAGYAVYIEKTRSSFKMAEIQDRNL
jgi:hypothetical protein